MQERLQLEAPPTVVLEPDLEASLKDFLDGIAGRVQSIGDSIKGAWDAAGAAVGNGILRVGYTISQLWYASSSACSAISHESLPSASDSYPDFYGTVTLSDAKQCAPVICDEVTQSCLPLTSWPLAAFVVNDGSRAVRAPG